MTSKHGAICRAFDELTSDSWARKDRGCAAAVLLTLWLDSFWLQPVGQPERRWPNSRTMPQPFTAGKSFFKDLQETPVGPGSWHLIWGVWSSWCQSRLLLTCCDRRPAVDLLVPSPSCLHPGRHRLGEISVLNPLNAKRESPGLLQPLLAFH